MQKKPLVETLQSDRFEMDYFTFGEGKRDLVLIPGVSLRPIVLSAGAVAGAYEDMADTYRITCFDRKKHMEKGYAVSDMADDTAEAMRLLGISGADVLGCSQGGMIAMVMAMRHPALFCRLALASTLARTTAESDAAFDAWLALSAAGDRRALNRDIAQRVYSQDYLNKYSRLFAVMENSGTPEELERFHILVEACRGFDVYEKLDQIQCPVLVIGSEQDAVVGSRGPRELAQKLGCRLEMYRGYSHAVYDEAPDFHQKLLQFFKSNAANA